MEVLVFASNIYIESTPFKHSTKSGVDNLFSANQPLGEKIDAVKNCEKRRGRLLDVRVGFTR